MAAIERLPMAVVKPVPGCRKLPGATPLLSAELPGGSTAGCHAWFTPVSHPLHYCVEGLEHGAEVPRPSSLAVHLPPRKLEIILAPRAPWV